LFKIASRLDCTSDRSNRVFVLLKSIKMSISLDGVASPRAVEPKRPR